MGAFPLGLLLALAACSLLCATPDAIGEAGAAQPDAILRARAVSAPSISIPAYAHIRDSILTKGAVRVIARLAAPASQPRGFELEASLSPNEAGNQRSVIGQLQRSVLSRVSAQRAATAKRYTFIPFMALEVDSADLQALIASPEVDFIEEDIVVPPLLGQSVPLIGGLNGAFDGFTGSGQTVAILDTGVEKTHPFLAGKVIAEGCFSTTSRPTSVAYCIPGSTAPGSGLPCSDAATGCYHGTHVAGIAAGNNGPSGAPSGVAKDATLIAVQVFSQFSGSSSCGSNTTCPQAYESDLISGLEYVYSLRDSYSIASVNLSLGGGQYSSNCDTSFPSFKTAIDNLRLAGIATVIAAGNGGSSNSLSFPGCISSAISVGATDKSDVLTSYSNSASFLNLLSPGDSIYSSLLNGAYGYLSGTSMATPHVAGAWAVLKSARPSATVDDILNALITSGKPITDSRNGIIKPRIQLDQASYLIAPVLSVTKTGNGSGTVTSTPPGISCGATCTYPFTQGSIVTLTATPDAGSLFSGWSGACSGTGSCTATMNSATSVSATFSLLPVNGLCGSANGQTLNTQPTSDLCSAGSASAVSGSGPWGWSCTGLYGGTTANCFVNITTFSISTSVANGIGGTITASAATVPYSGNVTFTITPSSGYNLSAFTDNDVNVKPTANADGTFTYGIDNITADHSVTATFTAYQAAAVPALPPFGVSAAVVLATFWGYGALRRRRDN